MYDQLTNAKGEKLFILVTNSTNSIKPYVKVSTWEECLKIFNQKTIETDNDQMLVQLIHKKISENYAEASTRCNRKGWGYDFFQYITIEPLYSY